MIPNPINAPLPSGPIVPKNTILIPHNGVRLVQRKNAVVWAVAHGKSARDLVSWVRVVTAWGEQAAWGVK